MKSYDLVVASGRMGSQLLSGERVPFPTKSGEGEGGEQSYVYQNVGFVTNVEAKILDGKRIRLRADIEDSHVIAGAEGAPPTVKTHQLNINVILADGVPLELTRVEGLTEHSGYVEVEAKILK
jgi:Flp pilus assembly secretin CpaC